MSFETVFPSIRNNCDQISPEVSARVRSTLFSPVQRGGIFPVADELVRSVARSVGSQGAHVGTLAALVQSEPVLGLRLLGLANSSVYGRSKPVTSMTTVVNQIGVARLGGEIESLGPVQSLTRFFMGRQVAAHAYALYVLGVRAAAELAEVLGSFTSARENTTVGASIYFAPLLALANRSPTHYAALFLDSCVSGKDPIEKRFQLLLADPASEYRNELLRSLALPRELEQMMRTAESYASKKPRTISLRKDANNSAVALGLTAYMLEALQFMRGALELRTRIKDVAKACGVSETIIKNSITRACHPYSEDDIAGQIMSSQVGPLLSDTDTGGLSLNDYLIELKAAFRTQVAPSEHHLLPQVALTTALALRKVFHFQRVIFLMYDERSNSLLPLVEIGEPSLQFPHLMRSLDNPNAPHMPDVRAAIDGKVVFDGEPVCGDDWPFVALPVRSQGVICGVIYADRAASEDALPLEMHEQVSLVALGELWQQVPYEFACQSD